MQFYAHFQRQSFPLGTEYYQDSSHLYSTKHLLSHVWHCFNAVQPDTLDNQPFQLWIKIPFKNFQGIEHEIIALSNPHINVVKCWWLDTQEHCIDSSDVTGDDFAYNHRDFLYPQYFFEFPPCADDSLYLVMLIDKRQEQLLASIHQITKTEMQAWTQGYNQLFGWILGIVGAIFLINLLLAFQVKERMYVYYSLFLFFVLAYIVADFGMLQPLLSFNTNYKTDAFRPIAMACTAPLYMLFFMQIMNIKKSIPWLFKSAHLFNVYSILFILLTAPFYRYIMFSDIKYTVLKIAYFNQIITITLLFIMSAVAFYKKIEFSLIFTISLFIFILTHVVNHFHHIGALPDRMQWIHFLPICYSIDCLLMGAVVAQKFIQFQGQSSALLIEMQNKDKEIADKLTEMKESDLSRISQFLHDNIGAEISALRLHIEKLTGEQSDSVNKEAWQKIVERTGKIADEIRKTSHQLSPSMLQQFGLMASIEHYIADVNESKKINIQFDHQGDCHLIQQKRAILILQIIHELTQNTIKHSDSKNMIIQLFCHENDSIELVVEDDGKGFDTKKTFLGLGLNQLQQIVTLSGGSFKIQSAINEGTTVNIELPKT